MSFPDYEPFADTGESFVKPLHDIYSQLKAAYDAGGATSEETTRAIDKLAAHIREFWLQDSNHRRFLPGSFGRNQNGEGQQAKCWDVQRKTETSICKWGLVNFDGAKIPKIEILAIDFSQSITYSIETNRDNLVIKRSNGSKTLYEEITIPVNRFLLTD